MNVNVQNPLSLSNPVLRDVNKKKIHTFQFFGLEKQNSRNKTIAQNSPLPYNTNTEHNNAAKEAMIMINEVEMEEAVEKKTGAEGPAAGGEAPGENPGGEGPAGGVATATDDTSTIAYELKLVNEVS